MQIRIWIRMPHHMAVCMMSTSLFDYLHFSGNQFLLTTIIGSYCLKSIKSTDNNWITKQKTILCMSGGDRIRRVLSLTLSKSMQVPHKLNYLQICKIFVTVLLIDFQERIASLCTKQIQRLMLFAGVFCINMFCTFQDLSSTCSESNKISSQNLFWQLCVLTIQAVLIAWPFSRKCLMGSKTRRKAPLTLVNPTNYIAYQTPLYRIWTSNLAILNPYTYALSNL